MNDQPPNNLASMRDEYGMPNEHSVRRCVMWSRKFAYLQLFVQVIGQAALIQLITTMTTVVCFYCTWLGVLWTLFLQGDPLGWHIPPIWDVHPLVHLFILFTTFVVVQVVREARKFWNEELEMRSASHAT